MDLTLIGQFLNGSGRQDAAKRQSGSAATRWPITVLFSNGIGAIRKQNGDWPPRCRVAVLPLCRFAAFCLPEPLRLKV